MPSLTWRLLTTSILVATVCLAQGGPPPWMAGGQGSGQPQPQSQPGVVDPLTSQSHWSPSPPGPGQQKMGRAIPFGNNPGGLNPIQPGGQLGVVLPDQPHEPGAAGIPELLNDKFGVQPDPWHFRGGKPGGGAPGTPPGGPPQGSPGGFPGSGFPGGPLPGTPGGSPNNGGGFPGGPGGGGMPGSPPGTGAPIAAGGPAGDSQLQAESDFPGEPTKATMYTYVPKTFKKGNPVVVALHHCAGTAEMYFCEYPDWPKMADQKGFMMIYAGSPSGTGGCWDVSSKASLKHDGGGDSQTIANMVKYAQQKYGCGKEVYVVGHSSGAMMTQLLGATYPDVFLAGAAYSGVPPGCFQTQKAQGADWNSTCTAGTLNESPQYWVQQVQDMYPGYNGDHPRMMLVHGTQDNVINFNDHKEAVKLWTSLHKYSPDKPTKQYKDPKEPNYEVSEYGSAVKAIAANGVTHNNPAKVDTTCDFFGL